MKKIFVLSFALLAALVACNKDQIVPENNDAPAASFTATIADTKITFTPDGAANEGFTTAFAGTERVFLTTAGATDDKYNLFVASEAAGKQCKFTISSNATYVNAPTASPVSFGAYLVNYDCMGYDTSLPCYRFGYNNSKGFIRRLYFLAGNGTLAQATKVQSLFATGTYDDAYPDLSFQYLTSILKVDINLPDGSGATTANTKIYVKGSGMITQAQLSSTTAAVNKNESPATPTFTITPDASVIDGDHIVFYVPLWAGKTGLTITDATIDFVVGINTYSISLGTKSVEPGKVYTFKPVAKPALKSIDKWVDDAAGSVTIATGLTESASTGLTYNSGTGEVSWEANTTGKPAKKTITFSSGESVAITQISVDDFKGDWTFNAKTFAGQNKIGLGSADKKSTSVNFGAPLGSESLYDEDTKLTLDNNIGIRGLFGSKDAGDAAVMNASLRLDRDKKTVEFYLFFDGRKAQATTTGDAEYPYVMFLPEFTAANLAAPYDFCPFPLGESQNYGYVRMAVSADATTLKYSSANTWYWGNTGDKYEKVVGGISINASKSATPTASDLRNANFIGASPAYYEYIYQANYNKNASTGFYFSR